MSRVVVRTVAGVLLLALGGAAGVVGDRIWQARFAAGGAPGKSQTEKPVTSEEEEPEPAAVVRTAIATTGELHPTMEAIGAAAVPPTAVFVESWPSEILITRVLVQPGEVVPKDAPLMQVALTREAETQISAAQLTLENALKALDLAQQRLERGLATRTDVVAAQAARDEAKLRVDRMQAGLPPRDGLLRAHTAGIVGQVKVQPGATAPGGSELLEINLETVVAQVGIDPAHVSGIAVGRVFEVRPVDDRDVGKWTGTVSLIAHSVNPTTRLVDATLTLSGDAPPRVGTPLLARTELAGTQGVIVPRAALVPGAEGMSVFVVRDGTASQTPVTVRQRDGDRVTLSSGCKPGDHVVVSGQSQLKQGMTVREVSAEPGKSDGGSRADH